ncbi:acetamidase [Gloeophyllum trabeum ATCC 11539]|uniref:amidase n=1 Tax=Gloeophyllum trabeum (strain ATCC 11539 / FP-39264 / Madison 617) TaxID=670483 RepID=S7S348_GLOTA|nr:acetamidase [Gloeophyllum trabeum ATCC 11539]EPQ60254.1 acetamidase [Gloeophyllum trabeum ATCC 11539]
MVFRTDDCGKGRQGVSARVVDCISWPEIRARKIRDRDALLGRNAQWCLKEDVPEHIKDVSQVLQAHLTEREKEIVHCDATSLVERLASRRYTATEVIKAHCHVATISQALTNCLTEVFFDDAIARAAELDRHMDETGQVSGPLHGLPVSIKDHINVKGHDTSTGYIAWAYNTVATKDAVTVEILRKAGAVLYVKTANPQTLLSLETNNNVFGRTVNPYNRTLTPGGSSGGESALIALHGSPLGLGTDIGGSIRVPAAYMGLYGFKASVARIPHAGLRGPHDGMEAIIGVLGPLARSARDLALFCRTMLQYEPWLIEPPLLEIPWKQTVVDGADIPQRLCFAILWDDGVVKPHPPILDALQRTKRALLAAGHEVINWVPLDHQAAWDLIVKLYFLDGGEEYRELQINDPMVPQTEWILNQVPNGGKPFTVRETFRLNVERETFRCRVAAHWNGTKSQTTTGRHVDAVISPAAATLAPPHDTTRWWGYTSYWNLADYPAAVYPVAHHRASQYSPPDVSADITLPQVPRNDVERFVNSQWDPEIYDNAPVSLQIIGRRLNEEKVLGMLNVVDRALNNVHN